jgi:hypothetical protein
LVPPSEACSPSAHILYATLAKGPKLPFDYQVNSTRHRELHSLPMSTQPALFINPIAPANLAPTLQREKTIGPHLRAANATNVAIMLPKSKSKHTDPNQTANTDGAKPAVDFKSR